MSKQPDKRSHSGQMLPRESARKHQGPGAVAEDRSFVKALARGIIVLEVFNVSGEVWLSVAEITDRTRLPKPTIMRFLRALQGMGYLHHSENRRRYRLGAGVLALGYAASEPFSLGEIVRPYLSELANVPASVLGNTDVPFYSNNQMLMQKGLLQD